MAEADGVRFGQDAGGPSLVLASGSPTRAALLRAAGLSFSVSVSQVDEATVKDSLRAEDPTGVEAARALAALKARRVSARAPDAYVVGADQLLVCEGEWLDKPGTRERARAQLRFLRGRRHELVTAVAVVRGDAVLWDQAVRPRLTVRRFTDAFLESYLDHAGEKILSCPGGYMVEDLGVHLFDDIAGDSFAILGLPLLPLLSFLRGHRVVPA